MAITEPKAFVFYSSDSSRTPPTAPVASDLVIFESASITGFGGPMAEMVASQGTELSPDQMAAFLDEFEDHWKHASFTYGGKVEILSYAGENKKKIDTIKKELQARSRKPAEGQK